MRNVLALVLGAFVGFLLAESYGIDWRWIVALAVSHLAAHVASGGTLSDLMPKKNP